MAVGDVADLANVGLRFRREAIDLLRDALGCVGIKTRVPEMLDGRLTD